MALQDLHADPDRLKHPMRKTGSGWERVSWDEAFSEVAERLRSLQSQPRTMTDRTRSEAQANVKFTGCSTHRIPSSESINVAHSLQWLQPFS